MRFAVILACATLSTAAVVSPSNPFAKRAVEDCDANCEGSFKANGGGECGDVDECKANCNGCLDDGMDFTYGTCGCIEKGGCDNYCKTECQSKCGAFSGAGFGEAVCQGKCGPSCNCD